MGVLTELLGGVCIPHDACCRGSLTCPAQVKFIKFFAWEERWIKRVLDARDVEIKWMIKCLFSFLSLHGVTLPLF